MSQGFIALDWGTSSFRAYLVAPDGAATETRANGEGIMSVKDGAFEPVFERHVAGWDTRLPVLASGMITSRQGWREVPYAQAPAGLGDLAKGTTQFQTSNGRNLAFVPGVSWRADDGVPDVMRGEETQIFGALDAGNGLFVMRGTHCKWVAVEAGRITRFATFMTGEMFGALKAHTILGRLMTGEAEHGPGFERGVRAGLAQRQGGAGLLHDLFSVRTLGLFGDLPGDQLAAYLSGLLIGSEIAGATKVFQPGTQGVTVIGGAALAEPFLKALGLAGIAGKLGPQDAAVRGLAKIGRQAGLIT